MTKDEAVEELYRIIENQYRSAEKDKEALGMAIKALEQEPCEDAISRQAVLEVLKDKWGMFSDANDAMQESIDTIEALSNVSPQPKTGHWIDHDKHIECDKCKTWFLKDHLIRKTYCPNCGCCMVEPQESEVKE